MNKMTDIKFQNSIEDKIFYVIATSSLVIFLLLVLYPIIYIISASFSSGRAVSTGRVILWPIEPNIEGYKAIFKHKQILTGFKNTIFYTSVGTLINLVMTLFAAYPLSRNDLRFRKAYMFYFVFTMYFSGGLIPSYILMNQIKFINTVWAMIIPGAVSVYRIIVTQTFIRSNIPQELLDSSQIDGCSDAKYFFAIVLPLSKPIIAVMALYFAVGHWNAYFNAMIYLNDPKLQPLQLILRTIIVENYVNLSDIHDAETIVALEGISNLLKYSLIVVTSAPVIMIYPFIQKYFVKGAMVGSIKG